MPTPPATPDGAVPPPLVERLRAAGCVFAEDEAALLVEAAGDDSDTLERLTARREAGEPLEQVIGWAAFGDLRVAVGPGVFVPRRRTEHLVAVALDGAPERPVVLDVCCGTGVLGLAVATARPGTRLYAVDVDPVAVACARGNLAAVEGTVLQGDLFDPLPRSLRGTVDLLLANVPYVPTASLRVLPAEARDHEPRRALDGGADGLDLLRRVAFDAVRWLRPGGRLLLETSERQAPAARRSLERSGLRAEVRRAEDADATVVVGIAPSDQAP